MFRPINLGPHAWAYMFFPKMGIYFILKKFKVDDVSLVRKNMHRMLPSSQLP